MPYETTRSLYRGTQAVWYVLLIVEIVLLFRFLLRLLGANPSAGFTDFVYTLSYPFVVPFQAVFQNTAATRGNVFEWTTLLAMLVYYLVALGIIRLLAMGRPVSATEAETELRAQERAH